MRALHALSQFLLDLDRITETSSPDQFFDRVMDRLRSLVVFDSGIWARGAMSAIGPTFDHVALFRQPPQMLQDYEEIKEFDPLFAQSAISPGVPVTAVARDTVPPQLLPFIDRYHLEQAMSTIDIDPRSQLLTGISVWRAEREHPFDASDRALMQAAFAHLLRAAGRCVLRHLVTGARTGAGLHMGLASCDSQGRLHQADDLCVALLAREFPDWRGPSLPAALCASLGAAAPCTIVLGSIAVRLTPRLPFVLVEARARIAWDALTEAERKVADLAADGLSYKAIARQSALAPSTVRNQLASAYGRLGIHNRAQLLALRAEGALAYPSGSV